MVPPFARRVRFVACVACIISLRAPFQTFCLQTKQIATHAYEVSTRASLLHNNTRWHRKGSVMVTALPALRTDLVSFDELVLEVFPFPPSDVDRDVERVWTDTRADERSVIVIRQYRNTAQVRAIFIFWLLVLLLSTFYVDVFPAAMCFRKITCFRLECGLFISQPHLHPVLSSASEVYNRLNNAFAITHLSFSRLFCQVLLKYLIGSATRLQSLT
jgi:hypothetical protein